MSSERTIAPSLRSNVFWLYGMTGLNYIIPAALIPYLVRVLGVEQYGLIAFSQAFAQYFVVLTDYGFNFSATRAIARHRDDPQERSRVFWSVMSVKLSLVVVGAVVLLGVFLAVPRMRGNWAVYLASYLTVVGSALFPTWMFQGMERMRSISVITATARLFSAVLIVSLVHTRKDTVLAAVLLSSGILLAGVIGIAVTLKAHVNRWETPSKVHLYGVLHEGRHLFLTTAAVSLYSNTNTFLVGLLAGNTEAGYFSLADKLIRAISGLIGPVIQAAYPRIIRLVADSKVAALLFIRRVLLWSICSAIAAGFSVLIVARPLSQMAFGLSSGQVLSLVRCLSIFPVLTAVTYILATLVMIPFGLDKEQSRLLVLLGVLNVCLAFVLIPRFGALGGVLGMSFVESAQIIGAMWILARHGIFPFSRSSPIRRPGLVR